jgi:hypothetical protein
MLENSRVFPYLLENQTNIWRVSPNASGAECASSPDCVKVFDGGFSSIIDPAFGADGKL